MRKAPVEILALPFQLFSNSLLVDSSPAFAAAAPAAITAKESNTATDLFMRALSISSRVRIACLDQAQPPAIEAEPKRQPSAARIPYDFFRFYPFA
jgi:hypothetical protein